MSKSSNIVRSVKWTDDPSAEKVFKDNKLKAVIEEVDLKDMAAWDENPARPTFGRSQSAVNAEKVSEYALAMKNGDVFPRCVLVRAKKKLYLAGGHHRIPAAKEIGDTSIEAYIVETDDEFTLQSLPIELNIRHGQGYSTEDRLTFALDKIKNFSISIADASRRYNVPAGQINTKKIADEVGSTLAKLGVVGINQTALVRLNVLKDNENLLVSAARLAKDASLNAEQVTDLTTSVRKQKNESAGIAEIERRRAELAAIAPPSYTPQQRQPRTKLMTAITLLFNLINETTMYTYQLTTKEQQKIATEKFDDLTAEIRSFLQRTKKAARSGINRDSE